MAPPPTPLPAGTHWIDTDPALAEVLPEFRRSQLLAFDTEADSYYSYYVKICLIQVSTAERDFIIDPLADLDLSPLGEIFAAQDCTKIFHAGANDIGLLRQQYDFEVRGVFDTMIAAQVLGLARPGLASLLQERFDVEQKKTYQTSDWRRRPLSSGQLQYAAVDTHYLIALMEQLRAELEEKGRLEEAEEDFANLSEMMQTKRTFDAEGFRRIRGAKELDGVQLRVLSDLARYREQIARKRDRSPHRVFPDRVLLEIARCLPQKPNDLAATKGLADWQVQRYGDALLRNLQRAVQKGPLPPAKKPRRKQPRSSNLAEALTEGQRTLFEKLRSWRTVRAEKRGVDASRVATTAALRAVARACPKNLEQLGKVEGMSAFRLREYGEEILQLLVNHQH
jgi:ribonuclease D